MTLHFTLPPGKLSPYLASIRCDSCPAEYETAFPPQTPLPQASLSVERQAEGWKRDVVMRITRPRVTRYDEHGRPETVENEAGEMFGDCCPVCLKAVETA